MMEASVASTSPVFTVDGDLERGLARDCVRLEVGEDVAGLRTLEARFVAVGAGVPGPPGPLAHLDGSLDLGRAMQVALGPPTAQRIVFAGTISALELVLEDGNPPVVVVLAEDALMRLRLTRRSRTYHDVTDADVARDIADAHGLAADVDADGPRYDVVQQLNQSDLAFLRDRARLLGAELWSTGRTLHFRDRTMRSGTELTLVRGAELLSVRLVADLSEQRSEVVVTGYDASTRAVVDERAGPEVVEKEIIGGRCGARLVTQALGPSASLRVREVALDATEAAAWARAEMLRRGRRFVTVTGTTLGSPDLVVGSRVRLQDVGAVFEGEGYQITSVRHTFDLHRGFRTRFDAERATLNEVA
ncbi:phage late control D family protein [Actinomycetospora lemnae]|uniref:Contractile injection system protein, VgrG/Pvc8 family n=1 Tax=Actinomycetospora lemnae TaxID=3019891 RepID=A0ABT5SRM1_9PSEU|nr:contractile injection system protein, VgrG/Pvc8 family [Actinomycetospora sp. DW7H6]MDD7965485.1 contractile injection system protein, VgrG/Pvc8 family [Actinomycetospora sp. DW7H6]